MPPSEARPFVDWLDVSEPELQQVRFSVLALGDRSYTHFAACGKRIDSALERLGGRRCGIPPLLLWGQCMGGKSQVAFLGFGLFPTIPLPLSRSSMFLPAPPLPGHANLWRSPLFLLSLLSLRLTIERLPPAPQAA